MDRFHWMQTFVAVAEEQGFARAGRRLGMTPPAVTRAIAALERHLGVKLLNRTTRQVRTTEAGERYLEDARLVLAQADAADEAASGVSSAPSGQIALTAPILFGSMYVTPGITEFLEQYPAVEINALFLDRNVDLVQEGIDLAVRIGELPDSSLRALRVGSVRQVLCASPGYLERNPRVKVLADLNDHQLIFSSAASDVPSWRFRTTDGMRSLRLHPRLKVSTNDAAREAAVSGFGITRLLSYQVAPQLKSGELKILLDDFEPNPWPVHIVHREGRYTTTRIRTLIDHLAEYLRAEPALQ